ncbi:MAG: DUF2971 domain-containing protein [Helicobacter sp.]|uniref:DUF2971 domain-containing protein n=1 Tax=Helicobacter sp. TaxID=218 RepID=UPI0023BF7F83|nr:DUF2971 domain-containing protein [Helicobacter sp.]MDE5926439.1 DUF2971 domain-containing protein [Helicobacter sp.]MDE7175944.1 DUF2971 domain-containing protein [Helicobacter sp.]
MAQDKSLEIPRDEWKTLTFCKFRGLVYEQGSEELFFPSKRDCEKYKSNFDFKEILQNSELYMPDFEEFNDVDEGRYWFYSDEKQNEKLAEVIRNIRYEKLKKKICSFSHFHPNVQWDLMWAHYANAHCGVRIDFRINPSYQGKVYKIKYTNQAPTYNLDEIPRHLIEIMTTKKKCFGYEREYRAIIEVEDKDKDKLPILIQRIILGRKFAENFIPNDKLGSRKFGENIIRIAKQILEICKNSPEIWAYKSRYSLVPKKIENIN